MALKQTLRPFKGLFTIDDSSPAVSNSSPRESCRPLRRSERTMPKMHILQS